MPAEAFTDFSVHIAPTTDGGTEVTVFGELDLATVEDFDEAIDPVLHRPGPVAIDMRACPFVDSSGIAALVKATLRLRDQKRTLRLRGVRDRVRRTLDLTGVTASELLVLEPPS